MSQFPQALGSRKAVEIIQLDNKTCLVLMLVNGPDVKGPDGSVVQPGCKRPPIVRATSFGEISNAMASVRAYWEETEDCCEECQGHK